MSCKCHPSPHSSSLKHRRKRPVSTVQPIARVKARCPSPTTRSMSDYDNYLYFATPRNTSTPHKSDHQPCNRSASAEGRHSWAPLDCSIYNSFWYRGHTGFSRGAVTPQSTAGSQHVSSSMLQPRVLFSPGVTQAPSYLTSEQSAEVFCLGAEC